MLENSDGTPSVDEDTLAKLFEEPDEGQPDAEDATTQDEPDVETEEVELEAEADDDDQPEVDTDDEAETAEDDEPELYYEIDGEEVSAAQLMEWKKGGLREKDYTQKRQADAEEKRVWEAQKQSEIQAIQQKQAQLQDALATFAIDPKPEPNWAELAATMDPRDYNRLKVQHEQEQAQKAQARQQYQMLQQQTHMETVQREKAALLQHIPEWSDPQVSEKARVELQTLAAEYDIPADEFGQMFDSRIFRVLNALNQMQKRVAEVDKAGAAITKKVVKAQPKLPTGAKGAKNQGNKAKAAKSLDRAIKSGDIDAVTDSLLNM